LKTTREHCDEGRHDRPAACFLEDVGSAVMVIDAEGAILDANRAAAISIGVPADELRGLSLKDPVWWPGPCYLEDGRPMSRRDLPALIALGENRRVDDVVFGVDVGGAGRIVWLLCGAVPVPGPDGRPACVVVTMTDITRQKRAEDLLTRVADQLHGVVHALPDLYFHLDADGRVVDYHIGSGFDAQVVPEDFVGRKPESFLPRHVARSLRKARAKACLSGATETFAAAIEVSGERHHYEFRCVALADRETVVLVRDITEHRRQEDAVRRSASWYRTIFERASVGIFIYDDDLTIVECNPAFERLTGAPREYFIGLSIRDLDDQRLVPALETALTGESAVYEGPYMPTAVGNGGLIDLSAQPLFDDAGHLVGGMAILASIREPSAIAHGIVRPAR
jgi:PAS domain S-box-containing protein